MVSSRKQRPTAQRNAPRFQKVKKKQKSGPRHEGGGRVEEVAERPLDAESRSVGQQGPGVRYSGTNEARSVDAHPGRIGLSLTDTPSTDG